jgi:hypothetical protein
MEPRTLLASASVASLVAGPLDRLALRPEQDTRLWKKTRTTRQLVNRFVGT